MYIDAKNMPTYCLAKQVGYQFWNQKSGPTIRKIFGIARSNLFWMRSPTILEPICHVSWITNPGKRAWWRGSWRSPLKAECEVNNFRRLNRSFRAGYIYIYIQIYLTKHIYLHIPNPTLVFLKQTLELSRLNVSLSELSWSNLGWQCHEHECHGLGRSCSKGHAIRCFWLVWLGHWVSRTSKHLSFWTGKKSPKKIQQTLRCTTATWVRGASIKVPFSLCTWRRTILPSVGVQLLPWRVSWWRCVGWWIFANDFCACFLFFCFHSFKKGCVSLQTTWAFHPGLD